MQNNIKFNFINLIEYKNLEVWDVKQNIGDKLLYNFPNSKLGKALKKAKIEWIKIENDNEYPILGVRAQGQGVYINRVAKGSELTMRKYQKSKELTLFYCKVRTVNGQWGVVYPEFADSYGSSNMQYLDIDFNILTPEYLELMLKSESITKEWDKRAIGADGRHFNLSTLLDLEIPLPSLDIQKALVQAYQNKLNQADKLEQEAANLEEQIDSFILEELGVNLREVKKRKSGKLYFAEFNELFNWVHSADEATFFEDLQDAKYPVTELGLEFDFISRPWKKKEESKEYIELGGIDPNFGVMKTKTVYAKKAPSRATQTVKTGDLIIGTTRPYLKKFAIIQDKNNGDVASSGFSTIQENKEKYNLYFLNEVLKSPIGIKQFEIKMTGALYPAITQADLLELKIPLPKIDVQNKIADSIQRMKDSQKDKFQQAQQLKKQALLDFENAIFKPAE